MRNATTPAASTAATNTPPSDGLADLTEQNLTARLAEARGRMIRGRNLQFARRLGVSLATVAAVGAVVVTAPQADARVLPVHTVTAHPGPVQVPSGATRCNGKGDYHATLSVRTTTKDRKKDHHVAVYLQEHQGGRARMVGYAWSQAGTTKVTVCVNPSRIDGGSGPAYVIVEDAIDGYTRPAQIRFGR